MARNRNDLFGFATAMAQTKATGYESRSAAANTLSSKNFDDVKERNAFRSAARAIRHNMQTADSRTMDKRTRYRMQRFYNGLSVG